MRTLALAWLKAYWRPIALYGSALLLGTIAAYSCQPRSAPIPVAEQHSIDSLAVTAPIYQAQRDSVVAREHLAVTKSAAAAHQAVVSSSSADSIGLVADSLQRVAEAQHDTLSSWRAVAMTRAAEVDTLHVANDSLRSALATQQAARLQADARATLAETRLAAVNDLNTRLAHDVATAGRCRILPFVSCPTRKETLVLAVVGGAAAEYARESRKH